MSPRQYIDPQPLKDQIAGLEKENADLKQQLLLAGPAKALVLNPTPKSVIFVNARVVDTSDLLAAESEYNPPIIPINIPDGSTLDQHVQLLQDTLVGKLNEHIQRLEKQLSETTEGKDAQLQKLADAGARKAPQGRPDWPVHSVPIPAIQSPEDTRLGDLAKTIQGNLAKLPAGAPYGVIDKFADAHRSHDRQLTGDQPEKKG